MTFDFVARSYQFLETLTFGNTLQRARTAFIPDIRSSRCALIVGEGDGRFLAELVRVHPSLKVDCVDASRNMLALAKQRVPAISSEQNATSTAKPLAAVMRASAREHRANLELRDVPHVQFHHVDIVEWSPPHACYDLIVTHFFLDCFDAEELSRVVAKLAEAASPDAQWLLTDFAIPTGGLAELHAKLWLRVMYLFFAVTTGLRIRELVDPSPLLESAGFRLCNDTVSRLGLIKSQLWQRSS